jgi:hypothetical protein
MRRVPYFKAWGKFAFLGDVTIWATSTLFILPLDVYRFGSDLLLVESQGEFIVSTTKSPGETADYTSWNHVRLVSSPFVQEDLMKGSLRFVSA